MPVKRFYRFGSFRLDYQTRVLLRNGELVRIPPKAIDTLIVLLERAGQPVEKKTLIQSVWPDVFVEEHNLAHHISILRKTLGDLDDGRAYIETIPKRGYRFAGDVSEATESFGDDGGGTPPEAFDELSRTPASQPTADEPATFSSSVSRRKLAVALAASGLGLPTIIWWRGHGSHTVGFRTVAVLPFRNLSADPNQDYVADGITELLIGNLAHLRSLRVTSRTSSMYFKNSVKKLADIARELKVDGIVEGSVMRWGNRVRITAQLIRASTDEDVWSQIYEREFQDIAALQVDIAQTIARQAGVEASAIGETRLNRRPAGNRDAFEEYLRGRHAWNKRSPEEIKKAIQHFEKAIDLDAAYAPAYAGLADAYNQLGTHLIGDKPPRETRPLAIAAATKAIDIDDELAEAYAALGYARNYDWDWHNAGVSLCRAIELNPSYAPVRIWYAFFLQQQGKQREAMEQALTAQELDPLSLIVHTQVGWIHAHQRNFNVAVPIFRDVLERDPNYLWAEWLLGQTYIQTGQLPHAIEVLEHAAGHSHRTPAILGTLGAAYARAGRREVATRLLRELRATGEHKYVSAHAFTWIYLGLGDRDQAFHWLEREFEEHSNALAWIGSWYMLDQYRDDPRYLAMKRRIGLSPANSSVAK